MRAATARAAARAATGMRAVTAGARPGATIAEHNVRRECSVRCQCIVLRVPARHRAAHGKQREQADEKEAIDDWHVERNHG